MKGRTYIGELKDMAGKEVMIAGWVDVRRDQGKLIFFDFRDMTGTVQGVILPKATEAHAVGEKLRSEWVVQVHGKVNARPEKNVQKEKLNGAVEIEILSIQVLNEATTPAFDVAGAGSEINEETRLKYRYLDLRRPRMQKNVRARHKIQQLVRNFFTAEKFTEIETPLLSATTPEGSRDYVVPSRLEPGHFYALPQSPQQYKQLLMSAGFEKYFQFARCMRDEDTRGDRQPEFTQLDMEMSFVERDDVMAINEKVLIEVVKTLYPEKKIQQIPFPRMTYDEVMKKYGVDKPDIRENKEDPNLLAFLWVIDFPFFEKDDKGGWTFTHNPFSRPQKEHTEWLMEKKNIGEIKTTQYDVVLNGYEIGGGSIRNHDPKALKKVFEIMGYSEERIQHNFGHMLTALGSGTPPHGGIAWGFDRFLMLLHNEPNIREVIPFAKTGEGKDPMMGAPTTITDEQLHELGISITKKKK
ncbi:MAG: aspartate--tRNA ligase [Candidatus Pacebacteria bacterium]|nr:aspartate--tRNA ligase [Candidatus Paceibacterota bacterium]